MGKIDEFLKKGLYSNKNTIMAYRSHLKKYFEVIDQDPDIYFDDGSRDYEADIIKFWEYLEGSPPITKRCFINTVQRFVCKNNKTLKDLEIWATITFRLKGSEAITEDYVPDDADLKKIMLYTDIRTRAVVMLAVASGMRIGEILKLLPSDVHLDENPVRINVRSEIAKNKRRRTTFITPEAKTVLEEWLRARDHYLKVAVKKCICNAKKDSGDPRLFPYTKNTIRYSWNLAVEKAGLGDKDIRTKRRKLHFHCIRKFFRSYFGNADFAEHLMGHKGYLSTYRQYNDKQLAEEYLKNIENLLIFEKSADISSIREQLAEKDKALQGLKQEIEDNKMQILELRVTIQELKNEK